MPLESRAPEPKLLSEWLFHRAAASASASAVTFEGTTFSYADFSGKVRTIAAALNAAGVQAGDRVGYIGFNSVECLALMFASAAVSAIFVPLNYRLTSSELAYVVADAGLAAIVADPEHLHLVDPIRAGIACSRFFRTTGTSPRWSDLSTVAPPTPESLVPPVSQLSDPAVILYTSGTTGRPKGAVLSHAALWTNNLNWILTYGITAHDTLLISAPNFHVSGLFVMLTSTLLMGGHVVLHRDFDEHRFIRDVDAYTVTMGFGVPTMLTRILDAVHGDESTLVSLRAFVVGGAPSPEMVLRRCSALGIPVSHTYGMTEAVSAVAWLDPTQASRKMGSVGTSMPLSQIAVTDGNGMPRQSPGITGEVVLKGDNIITAYWNDTVASAQAFTPDGWFRTGDIGYFDDDGYLFVCDRLKDMIISGGENVYPAEVENVIIEHEAVGNVAVVGMPDPHWGEVVVAAVVLHPGKSLDESALRAFCDPHLARYKIPRRMYVVDELPLSGAGKVLKGVLRASLASAPVPSS